MAPFVEMLRELLSLPGATYSCIADRATGEVLADLGQGAASTVAPSVVVQLSNSAMQSVGVVPGDDFDDLMITSRLSYHLVRQLGTGSARPLLVYLCLERSRSNLAAARRELTALTGRERPAGTEAAAVPEPASDRSAARPPEPQDPALHMLPPLPRRVPSAARIPPRVPTQSDREQRPAASRRPAVIMPAARMRGEPPPPPPVPASMPPPPPVPLPRRPLSSPPPRPEPDAPADLPTPPVLAQRWATDQGTMRRLLIGLRRLV